MKRPLLFAASLIGIIQSNYSQSSEQVQQSKQIKAQKTTAFMSALSDSNLWNQNKVNFNNDVLNGNIDVSSLNFNAININGIDFSEMLLSNINLSGAIFNNCNFKNAKLLNANLSRCTFNGGTLQDAQVQRANFENVVFNNVLNLRMQLVEGIDNNNYGVWFDIPNANRSVLDVIKQQKSLQDSANGTNNSTFKNYYQSAANILSDLIACMKFDLSNQNFNGQDFTGLCFRNVNFNNTKLQKTELRNTDFRGANLKGIWLQDHERLSRNENMKQLPFYMRNMRVGDNVWLPNDINTTIDSLEDMGRNCSNPNAKTIIKNLLLGINLSRTFNW